MTAQPSSLPGLPRASRSTARLLFVLSQVMYLIFYLCALSRWEKLAQSSDMAWGSAGTVAFVVYLVSALVGLAVRLYLISATAMDYHLLGKKYRILLPGLFLLDMIWALAPFLLADRIGLGLALGATAVQIGRPYLYGRGVAGAEGLGVRVSAVGQRSAHRSARHGASADPDHVTVAHQGGETEHLGDRHAGVAQAANGAEPVELFLRESALSGAIACNWLQQADLFVVPQGVEGEAGLLDHLSWRVDTHVIQGRTWSPLQVNRLTR